MLTEQHLRSILHLNTLIVKTIWKKKAKRAFAFEPRARAFNLPLQQRCEKNRYGQYTTKQREREEKFKIMHSFLFKPF